MKILSNHFKVSSVSKALSRLSKLGLVIIDQITLSGANFFLNIFLAISLTHDEYGSFSFTMSVIMLFSGLHNALILEPMSTVGPRDYSNQLHGYLKKQVFMHFVLTILSSLLIISFGILLQIINLSYVLIHSLITGGIYLPFLMFPWTTRRIFYILQRPMYALASSILYAFAMVMCLCWMMSIRGSLSSSDAISAIGVAGILSGSLIFGFSWDRGKICAHDFWKIVVDHWNVGKWILPGAFFSLCSGAIQIFFLTTFFGISSAGVFRALQNVLLPIIQIMAAISNFILPILSHRYVTKDIKQFQRTGVLAILLVGGLATAYGAIIWMFATPIEQLLYGGRYSEYSQFIPILGVVAALSGISNGIFLILRSVGKDYVHFTAGLVTFIVALLSATPLVLVWGILGALVSLLLVYLSGFFVMLLHFSAWLRNLRST